MVRETAGREPHRWREEVHRYDGLTALEGAGTIPAGIVSVDEGGTAIECLYAPNGADTTVIVFHAALRGPRVPLPMFAGVRITRDQPVNRIHVSDPCLASDPALRLSWYAGTRDLEVQTVLPQVLRRLVEAAGGKRVILFGPSAGGFAALWCARAFPGSLVLASNPQIILANYGRAALRAYVSACFGGDSDEDVARVLRDEIVCGDLRGPYAEDFRSHVLYLQNRSDDHVRLHLEPFLEATGRSIDQPDGWLTVLLGDWGEGHTPPPSEMLAGVLGALIHADEPPERVLTGRTIEHIRSLVTAPV